MLNCSVLSFLPCFSCCELRYMLKKGCQMRTIQTFKKTELGMQRIEVLWLLHVHRGRYFFLGFQYYCCIQQSFIPIHCTISIDRRTNRLLNPASRMCMYMQGTSTFYLLGTIFQLPKALRSNIKDCRACCLQLQGFTSLFCKGKVYLERAPSQI